MDLTTDGIACQEMCRLEPGECVALGCTCRPGMRAAHYLADVQKQAGRQEMMWGHLDAVFWGVLGGILIPAMRVVKRLQVGEMPYFNRVQEAVAVW